MTSLSTWTLHLTAEGKSPQTVRNYSHIVRNYLKSELGPVEYLAALRVRGRAPSSISTYLRVLRLWALWQKTYPEVGRWGWKPFPGHCRRGCSRSPERP